MDLKRFAVAALFLCGLCLPPARAAERVAFVGDSITHDGRYLGFVQLAETLANPDNRAQYLNLGICGDTTGGVLARWQKVVDAKPTDIIVMLGMNDTGVGTYYPNAKPDVLEKRAARLAAYEVNLREIVQRAKRLTPSVRLMTPSPYDEYGNWQKGGARHVGADSEGLASCVKSVRVVAREENVPVAEVHDPFVLAVRNSPDQKLGGTDRVHPVDGGHLVMAACVVRSRRGGDGEMPPTVWDASKGLSLDYRPSRFGFPRVKGMDELDKTTDLGKVLGREVLVVKDLAKGTYRLFADGTPVGCFTEADLAAGLDLQKFDTPSARQAMKAAKIAERYSQIQADLQYVALVEGMIAKYGSTDAWLLATKSNATNVAWSRHYAKHKPLVAELRAECDMTPPKLAAASRPVAYRFELKPCTDEVGTRR